MLKDGGLSERKCFQANKDAKAIVFGCAAGTMSSKKETLKMKMYVQCYFFLHKNDRALKENLQKFQSPKTYELQ